MCAITTPGDHNHIYLLDIKEIKPRPATMQHSASLMQHSASLMLKHEKNTTSQARE